MNEFATRLKPKDYEDFVSSRRSYLGGSDAAGVMGVGRYGCKRKVVYSKINTPKDFPDEDKAEFRRGRRLEHIAAAYYEEVTGRQIRTTIVMKVHDKPHLAVNADRLVYKKEDEKCKVPGYLELKVVGRWSMNQIKKEGLIDDYILQVEWGCAVGGLTWGSYGIYCPETDELLHWDHTPDTALGEALLEAGDDLWSLNVENKILPDPLPEGSKQCEGCPWSLTCQQRIIPVGSAEIIQRPDLEGLVAKFAEVKGMGSEVSDAEEEIKAEILAAIGEKPGTYQCGKYQLPFTITETKRFSSEEMKKAHPEIYEKFRKTSVTKMLRKPKEI